jgi:hypothetical protein
VKTSAKLACAALSPKLWRPHLRKIAFSVPGISPSLFPLLQVRMPFSAPFWRWRSPLKVIEELLQTPRVIFLINSTTEPMFLTV